LLPIINCLGSTAIGNGNDAKEVPYIEVIDHGNGLARSKFPDVTGLRLPKATKFLAPVDFTKTKQLPFAKRVMALPNGSQLFEGAGLVATINQMSSLTKDQAAEMASDGLVKYFPELGNRTKVKEVDPIVSMTSGGAGVNRSGTCGFLVQFQVLKDNVPVWDNRVHVNIRGDKVDGIDLLVYGEAAQAGAASGSSGFSQPLDAGACLTKAMPRIRELLNIRGKYEVLKAELFYASPSSIQGKTPNFDDDFIPAWHIFLKPALEGEHAMPSLHGNHVSDIWLNAWNGDVIGTKGQSFK
jgi:hypothetical protein